MEGIAASVESDCYGLLHNSVLELLDIALNLSVGGYSANGLGVVVLTVMLGRGVARLVRVVRVEHDAPVFLEVPSPAHPATIAAVGVVLSEAVHVVLTEGVCAVNELLL